MNRKDQIQQTSNLLQETVRQPKPTLGIDLDGCVDEAPMFFNIFSHVCNRFVVSLFT